MQIVLPIRHVIIEEHVIQKMGLAHARFPFLEPFVMNVLMDITPLLATYVRFPFTLPFFCFCLHYFTYWLEKDCDEEKCGGNGVCSNEGECICNGNFVGPNCTLCSPGFFGPNCNSCMLFITFYY